MQETRVARFILAGLLIALCSTFALAQDQSGIRVTGTGTVYGEPDLAVFEVGIDSTDPDLATAVEHANQVASAIMTALTEAGVAETDLRTGSFNVWREDIHSPEGEPRPPTFRVVNSVHVTVRDITRVGDLLGLALDSGANQVSGVRFILADPVELRAQARELAMADALRVASQLADLGGVELGAPLFIEERQVNGGPQPQAYAAAMETSVPTAAGELAVTVSVTVNYGIVDSLE